MRAAVLCSPEFMAADHLLDAVALHLRWLLCVDAHVLHLQTVRMGLRMLDGIQALAEVRGPKPTLDHSIRRARVRDSTSIYSRDARQQRTAQTVPLVVCGSSLSATLSLPATTIRVEILHRGHRCSAG